MVYLVQFQPTHAPVILIGIEAELITLCIQLLRIFVQSFQLLFPRYCIYATYMYYLNVDRPGSQPDNILREWMHINLYMWIADKCLC